MKTFRPYLVAAAGLLAVGTTPSYGADAPTQSYASTERAIEASSINVTLPAGAGGALIVTPCPGCAPLTLRATATTTYFMHKQKVTLGELKSAINGRSIAVTVFSSVKTHELTRVIADLEPTAAPTNTTPVRAQVRAPVRK